MEEYDKIRRKETQDIAERIFKQPYDFLYIRSESRQRLAFLLLTLQKAVGKSNVFFTKPRLDTRVNPKVWVLKIELKIPKAVLQSVFKYNPPQSKGDEVGQ